MSDTLPGVFWDKEARCLVTEDGRAIDIRQNTGHGVQLSQEPTPEEAEAIYKKWKAANPEDAAWHEALRRASKKANEIALAALNGSEATGPKEDNEGWLEGYHVGGDDCQCLACNDGSGQ